MSSPDVKDDNANNSDYSTSNNSDSLYSSGDSIGITCNTSHHEASDSDKQVSEKERNWADLPALAVENIYSFLSRTDQSRMSLVCSRWANEFSSPCLWKTMKFYLPEQDYSSELYPEVRFARKYASMFRHVEIICKRVRTHLIDVIWEQLKYFLQAMTSKSQLVSIKFLYIGHYFRRCDDFIYEDLLKTIISFFNSQENLKTVVFQESRFSKEEGMELLKSIFHSDNNTIKNLTIRKFVNESPVMELSSQYMSNLSEVCRKIANVQSLEVDYTQIFEDVIDCLHKKLSSGDFQRIKKNSSMSTINIYCKDTEELEFRGIHTETWKYLTNVFPDIKVKMDVTVRIHVNKMEKFLVREIPLKTLDFRFEKLSVTRIDMSALFTHLQICKYQARLEVLNVLWLPPIADFAGSVIPFIQSCEKLQTFHLHARYTPSGIENVLKAFLENHPASLKSITIWSDFVEEEDEPNVRALSEEYFPLFNAQGMECFLVVDRRLRREPEDENEM